MIFMVVEGFGKADPDIEDAQAAAHATHEIVSCDVAEWRINDEEAIVGPSGSPGQHDEQNAEAGAYTHEHQHGKAMHP